MNLSTKLFGTASEGIEVTEYIITNRNGASVAILDYGLAVRKLNIKDKDGILRNVVLGYDDISGYEKNAPYLGVVVGRYAGRISGGSFSLNGTVYELDKNNGNNTLHGGKVGFSRKVWELVRKEETNDSILLEFSLHSPHLDEGFPGSLEVRTAYTFNDKNELIIEYRAKTDRPTLVNLTNHSYFNFNTDHTQNIDAHKLMIDADKYIESGDDLLGSRETYVKDTPFDFRKDKQIKTGLYSGHEQISKNSGYDNVFRLNKSGVDHVSAVLSCEETGISMSVRTTTKAIVLYTSNFMDDSLILCDGIRSAKHLGVCLETQYFPNDVNTDFIQTKTVLSPGEEYYEKTVYTF